MLIIFDGAPNSGKSTLASFISKKYKIPVWPFLNRGDIFKTLELDKTEVQFQISAESIAFTIAQLHSLKKFDLILDRFHISNLAFGRFFLRDPHEDAFDSIEKLLHKNSILIQTDCNEEHCFERSTEKQRNKKYTVKDYGDMRIEFTHAYLDSDMRKINILTSNKTIYQTRATASKFIDIRRKK